MALGSRTAYTPITLQLSQLCSRSAHDLTDDELANDGYWYYYVYLSIIYYLALKTCADQLLSCQIAKINYL